MKSTALLMRRSRVGMAAAAIILIGLVALAWVGVLSFPGASSRDRRELVIVGYGGSYGAALRTAVIVPFQRESNVTVRYDESCCARVGPTLEAGGFAGDLVVGVDFGGLLSWAQRGFLLGDARLTRLSRDREVPERYRYPGALVNTEYAYVMAAHGRDASLPQHWREFWDLRRYPGRRALIRATPVGQLEAALLADGVPADRLYPLDVERALKKLDRLRDSVPVLFANSPADLVNLIARGDASYAIAFSNRLEAARHDGLPVAFTYAEGLRTGNGFGVLKGARNADAAIEFLEFASRPEVVARFAGLAGLQVAKPDDPHAVSTTTGEDSSQVMISSSYWAEHRTAVGERWVRWLVR